MITEINENTREMRCFIILVKNECEGLDVLITSGYEGFFNGEEILQELEVSCLFFSYEEAQAIAQRCSPKTIRIVPVNVFFEEPQNMNYREKLGCSTISTTRTWWLPRKTRKLECSKI